MDAIKINIIMGYVLLIAGLLVIIMPIYQTYNIFIGKSLPPEILKNSMTAQPNQNVGSLDFQKQIENAFIKIMPLELINKILNLIIWMILSLIFLVGGKQIAEIGIKLIKN